LILDYIDEAWELINILPKNPQLEEEVKKLGTQINEKIDWNKYIDTKSIYKLSYCLQIIKSFLIQTESNSPKNNSEKINKNWLETFRKNKGIKHLITVIYQYKDAHFSSNLGFSCLNETINLLKHVTKVGDEIRNESEVIISKLFEIINFIFKSSEDKFNSEKTKEIQQEYKRKKDRQLLMKSYNQNQSNNLNNNDEIPSELDEFHPCIRDIWLKEENSIQIVISFLYIFEDEKLINSLITSNYLESIINSGMILLKNTKIKQNLIDFLKKLYENISTNIRLKNYLSSHIFLILFDINTISSAVSHSETSEAYFKLFTEFLSLIDCNTLKELNLDKKMNEMTDFMINNIIKFVETKKFDTALTGFLSILRIFILIDSHIVDRINENYNLYEILIDKCIFSKCKSKLKSINLVKDDDPKLAVPICRSSNSRKAAFSLLSALCYNNPTYVERLLNFLLEYHELGFWRSKRFMSWNIVCSSEEKSSTNFVGLQNLGCICYMNSLLQQFYMIPTLRETLLSTELTTTGNKEDYVLFQLQKIFSSLKTSDRQYHNPKDFCTNFKGFDNQPVNVLEQMDVDEFFNLLIDRVESNLKGSKMEKVFKYHFGGMLTNELICKGCPHYSEREESFNSISLQVKNKKSIIESLESFVEGEMLEGENAYFCEKCEKKVNTLRRQCLKKLPKTLIIVLKRFEFDYDAMTKFKVNDYCEFPYELNVEKYTQEYLQKNEKIKEKNEAEGKTKSNDDTNNETESNSKCNL
jgi:ubiquitin carboxyl-terminal hydrolase 9/24